MNNNHGGNLYNIEREYGIPAGDIIDFSVNLNPIGTPDEIKKIIADNLDEITRYPDPDYIECRKSIASHHGLPYKYITTGNGATELIFLYCRVLKPARALIIAPAFSEYRRALESVKAEISYFELKEKDNFKTDVESLKNEISRGYDLVVICNPNNPSGTLISKDDMMSIAEHSLNHGCRILLDESFVEFCFTGTAQLSVVGEQIPENIFVVRSLTKIFSLPGLRLGYGISFDDDLNRKLAERKEPWSVNVLAAKSANFLPDALSYFEETRRVVFEENNFILQNIKNISWLKTFSSPVNYMIVKILSEMTSAQLAGEMIKKNVMIRDASNFQYLNEKFIRIAVKDRESNQKLIDALKEIN